MWRADNIQSCQLAAWPLWQWQKQCDPVGVAGPRKAALCPCSQQQVNKVIVVFLATSQPLPVPTLSQGQRKNPFRPGWDRTAASRVPFLFAVLVAPLEPGFIPGREVHGHNMFSLYSESCLWFVFVPDFFFNTDLLRKGTVSKQGSDPAESEGVP